MASGAAYYTWNLDDGPQSSGTWFDAALRPGETPATLTAAYEDYYGVGEVPQHDIGGVLTPIWPDISDNGVLHCVGSEGESNPQATSIPTNLRDYPASAIYAASDSGAGSPAFPSVNPDWLAMANPSSAPDFPANVTGSATVTVPVKIETAGPVSLLAWQSFYELGYVDFGGGDMQPYVAEWRRYYYSPETTREVEGVYGSFPETAQWTLSFVVGYEWKATPSPNCQSLIITLTPQAGGDFGRSDSNSGAADYETLYGSIFEWMEPSAQIPPQYLSSYKGLFDTYEVPAPTDYFTGLPIPGRFPTPHALFIGDHGTVSPGPVATAPYVSEFRLTDIPLMLNGGVDVTVKPVGPSLGYGQNIGGKSYEDTYQSQYIWGANMPQTVHVGFCGAKTGGGGGKRPSLFASMMMTEDAGRRPAAITAGSKDQPGAVLLQVSEDTGETWPSGATVDAQARYDPSLWFSIHSGAPSAMYADGQGGIFLNKASASGESGDWAGPAELSLTGTFPIVAAHPDGALFVMAYVDQSLALCVAASSDGEAWSKIGTAVKTVDFSQTGRPGLCWLGAMPLLVYGDGANLIAIVGIDGGASWMQPITISHDGPYCGITAAAKEGVAYVGAVSMADPDKPVAKFWASGSLGDAWQEETTSPPLPSATGAAIWCMEHTGRLLWGMAAHSYDDGATWLT